MAASDIKESWIKGDISEFAEQMRKLVNNKDWSDIRFIIGPNRKNIYGHRCILSTRCQVFSSMLKEQAHPKGGPNLDIPLVLTDVSPEAFSAMIEYIYTNCVTLTTKNATDVLGISLEYGLDGLTKLCVEFLIDNLNSDSVCATLEAATKYGQDVLKEKCIVYMEDHTKDVLQSKKILEISEAAFCLFLESDKLEADELDLFSAVRQWTAGKRVSASQPACEFAKTVIQHIRLPLLSPAELQEIEQTNESDRLIPMEMLSFAWKCHALGQGRKDNPQTRLRRGTTCRDSHKILKEQSSS